jgi:flagellar assembly protein FliH
MLEQAQSGIAPVTIYPMEYRAIVAAGLAAAEPMEDTAQAANVELEARIVELDAELATRSREFGIEIKAACEAAREEGRRSERNEHALQLAAAAQALAGALEGFRAGRDRYLADVEKEVVRLALAIAARVLHRETMMDPLLLAGAVRVALGQLADITEVRLKVPAAEQELWREMLRLIPNLPLHPEVIADEALKAGECLMETHLGSVDLGVRSQLAEIERGFFDLLEQRAQGSGLRAQDEQSVFSDQRSGKVQSSEADALSIPKSQPAV